MKNILIIGAQYSEKVIAVGMIEENKYKIIVLELMII
jgi:hypothetical protein